MKRILLAVLIGTLFGTSFGTLAVAQKWQPLYKLTSPDPTGTDSYAKGVAIDGNTAVVGALGSTVNGWLGAGAAYVYIDGQQVAKLTPSDAGGNLNFGASVGISGDIIVVGARGGANKKVWTPGGLYIFEKPAGGWQDATETLKVTLGNRINNRPSVAVEGTTALFGWPGNGVYVFDGSQGWQQTAVLTVANQSIDYGRSVAISNGTVVVGDPSYSSSIGAVYVFQNLTQVAMLTTSDKGQDSLGLNVSISGQTVAASVKWGSGTQEIGAAYVFVEPLQGWEDATETARLTGVYQHCACEPVATDGAHIVTAGLSGHALVYNQGLNGWTNHKQANGALKMGAPWLTDAVAMQKNTSIVGSFNYHHQGMAVVFTTGQ